MEKLGELFDGSIDSFRKHLREATSGTARSTTDAPRLEKAALRVILVAHLVSDSKTTQRTLGKVSTYDSWLTAMREFARTTPKQITARYRRVGDDAPVRDALGFSLAHYMALSAHANSIMRLKPKHREVTIDIWGNTPHHLVATRNLVPEFRRIVSLLGEEPLTATNLWGMLPVHVAAGANGDKLIKEMLKTHPNTMTAIDRKGRTPLVLAIEAHASRVVPLLIKAELAEPKGISALEVVCDKLERTRVSKFETKGTILDEPVAYRVSNGKFTCERGGKMVKATAAAERDISKKYCPKHYEWIQAVDWAAVLIKQRKKLTKVERDKVRKVDHPKLSKAAARIE